MSCCYWILNRYIHRRCPYFNAIYDSSDRIPYTKLYKFEKFYMPNLYEMDTQIDFIQIFDSHLFKFK